MDAKFRISTCKLTLSFNPNEAANESLRMQELFKEEQSKGYRVPKFRKNFFRKFASSRKEFRVVFGLEDLGFAMSFIEEILERQYQYTATDQDILSLEKFWYEMIPWVPEYNTIH